MAKKLGKIGRYKLLGELGRGAMGIVYRAEDPALDRVVALKTILLTDDEESRKDYHKRFFLEAKAAGKLTHPHIVTTFDFGEEGDIAYMAMELLEGKDLRRRLKDGSLSTLEAVEIAAQVADGLGFAHERGVVHRDIKPGNIMLLKRNQAKIMDFGIARQRSADFKTSTGIVMGTPRFMSPEQIAGSPVDHRSDIFSLGTVLYEMLTQTALFAGEDTPQIAHNVATLEHTPASRMNAEVTSMLDFVVAKALKKDPELRYQDANDLASDLRTCLVELRVRHGAPAPERNGKEKTGRTKTVKLDATDKAPLAPAASAIVSDTRLPLSPQFDCAGALSRLERPGRRDQRVLGKPPRPVGVLRRFSSDAGPRLFFVTVAIAGALAAYIAL